MTMHNFAEYDSASRSALRLKIGFVQKPNRVGGHRNRITTSKLMVDPVFF